MDYQHHSLYKVLYCLWQLLLVNQQEALLALIDSIKLCQQCVD